MSTPTPTDAVTPNAEWRCNTPALLAEILSNNHMGVMKVPLNLFSRMLGKVAERASQINDAELNGCMARLALYEITDPYSKEYDSKKSAQLLANKVGKNAVRAVNLLEALEAVAEAGYKMRNAQINFEIVHADYITNLSDRHEAMVAASKANCIAIEVFGKSLAHLAKLKEENK